jgi:hypothetical protein
MSRCVVIVHAEKGDALKEKISAYIDRNKNWPIDTLIRV